MKKILALVLGVLLLQAANAQEKLPPNFHLTKLKNGLDVLVIEDKTVPLITVEICVKNGSYTEEPEYNGLSHLYEHMFFKANKDLPSQEAFLNRKNELGLAWNGTTSYERVNYFSPTIKVLVEGLKFMNSAIRYPLFMEEEMKKENPVVDGEFQRAESNPTFWLFNDLNKHLWGDLFSRKNIIGNHDIILTATKEKMQTIQKKYYYPNNSLLILAGDVEHAIAFKKADEILGDWAPSDFDPFVKYPVPEFKPMTKSELFFTVNANTKTPMIAFGYHGPDTRNDIKGTYVADVFSTIVGQKSSKLQEELVDTGLALDVSVNYQTCKYTGPIIIFVVPSPDKVKACIDKIEEHTNQWDSDDYFTDEQLETAKTLLAISDARSREKTSSFVHSVSYWWASATIDYYTSYVENIKKVTRQEIKDYVQKYIKGKPHATGILTTAENRPALEATLTATKN